jgi:hypothetical protein
LPWLNGTSLQRLSVTKRKARLRELLSIESHLHTLFENLDDTVRLVTILAPKMAWISATQAPLLTVPSSEKMYQSIPSSPF